MKRFTLGVALLFVLASCGEAEEDKICDCISYTGKLNEKANEILRNGVTDKTETELRALKAEKNKRCAAFEKMSGPEMKKRMETCD